MTAKPRFTASDGAAIAYTDTGTGRPLLCLAGLTRNSSDFDYMQPHLPSGWRVICLDYRGRGESEWTGAETYTVPREARDAVELLDHLGLPQAAVLGTSRGGMIGMFLGATARERVAGLALNDVGPELDMAGLARIADYVGRRPAARTISDFAAALPAASPGMDNVPASRWLEEAERHARIGDDGRLALNYDPALRDSFMAAVADGSPDLWPLFDACAGLPLALIRGANSDLLSPAATAEMRRRRPDMIFDEVPDRAHIPFLDEPAAVAVLHEWLAAVAATGLTG